MFCHASREGKHGVRAWWHFGERSCLHTEIHWWYVGCRAGISNDDEGWTLSLAFPPFGLWIVLDSPRLWLPQRKSVFHWETPPREVWLPEGRQCEFSFSDWTLRVTPWGKTMEWGARDPWWVRGLRLDLKQFVLGRQDCAVETLRSDIPVVIPMPEGNYRGIARVERRTWTRPRWFGFSRVSTWIDVPNGVPHSGKGENSWDCGDDGIWGCGVDADDVPKAIGHYVESVMKNRKRYGMPSDEALAKAEAR